MDGVDPMLIGLDMLPALSESMQVVDGRTTNWTAVPCPTVSWAVAVHPELEPTAALARLWNEVAHICRLNEPDPIGGLGAAAGEPERDGLQAR